jgi:hypothetical protein
MYTTHTGHSMERVNNIIMDLGEIGWKGVDWIDLW